MTTDALRRTSLYDAHVAAGGRLVPFAGWELPIQYAGISEEHEAVRTRAGLFDVSHMGEIVVEGPGALDTVQRLITNNAARLEVGQGLYSPMCLGSGGIIDDLTVFRQAATRYLFIVNAATRAKDLAWMQQHAGSAIVSDRSDEFTLLALQGPRAEAILSEVSGGDIAAMPPFHMRSDLRIAGVAVHVSRTGYTGEDGFEIAGDWSQAAIVWDALLRAGKPHGLTPAGLGARDTLRLEAGFMLYGSDIDEATSPLEAPLGWTVKFEKAEFIGRDALARQKAEGPGRKLVGLQPGERAIPRQHFGIRAGGQTVGEVTSGTFSPTLRRPIAMGYVTAALAAAGTVVEIDVRGKPAPATVVRLPFYRRPKTS
jgi:aminomethyltransferase